MGVESDPVDDVNQGEVHSLLIAGIYEHFTADLIWPLVRAAARRPNVRLTFLTGRDAASLSWFTAKQYVHTSPEVRELGLYTVLDRGLTRSGIHVRDERGMETADVKSKCSVLAGAVSFCKDMGRMTRSISPNSPSAG